MQKSKAQAVNMMESPHSHESHDHTLHYLALVTGAIILAPYALPAVGVGDANSALSVFERVCGQSADGTGLAGNINNALASVPVIGSGLASGGLWTAATTGTIGIGGYILGKHIESQSDEDDGINWGKVIRYGALATSALIALPALLTGINMGLSYIALAASGAALMSLVADGLNDSIGTIGKTAAENSGLSGGMALLPHLLTCGASFFPAIGTVLMNEQSASKNSPPPPSPNPSFVARELQRREQSLTIPPTNVVSTTQDKASAIRADVVVDAPLRKGTPCHTNIVLRNSNTGKPLTEQELERIHTERIHMLVIDDQLKDYHHVHPQPTNQAGIYQVDFTPTSDHKYTAWLDITPTATQEQSYIKCDIPSAAPIVDHLQSLQHNDIAEVDGLHFSWKSPTPLTQGTATTVTIDVTDAQGKSIRDLEPIMGAYAHLVGFSADGTSLIHSHPIEDAQALQALKERGTLTFHLHPEQAGDHKLFLQVQRHGEVSCTSFSQPVLAVQHTSQKTPHSDTQHTHAHKHTRATQSEAVLPTL